MRRGKEREERRQLGVVARNMMMGLYYPSVLSVSVYLDIFSYPPLCCAAAAVSLHHGSSSTVHETASERGSAVSEHEMLINYEQMRTLLDPFY